MRKLLALLVACGQPAAMGTGGDQTPPDSAPDVAASTCGQRAGARGMSQRHVTIGGVDRTYIVYLPADVDAATPVPLVYVFHGFTMSGDEMYAMTRYPEIADREHIAVVFPNGEGGPNSLVFPWNVADPGQHVCGNGDAANNTGDDLGFVDAMKADIAADQCIDDAHVYSTGFSMGGYFSEHVGCVRPDFRAIAPHSGGTLADLSACTTGHVPVILFHGTGDAVISPGCDDPASPQNAGFPPAATLWAQKNGCAATFTTVETDGAGGGKGQCMLYDGCPADGQVELCTFTGMAHCWAGGETAGAGGNACPTFADASELEWAFFKTYAF